MQRFVASEESGGILLLVCTLVALGWANSPWAGSYENFWHMVAAVNIGEFRLAGELHFWVNDTLMPMFFFVAGLEIKREFLVGELAQPRKAALPVAAALAGAAIPAMIFLSFNMSGAGSAGWGIPMATDIAFVIGLMALLGDRIPNSLKYMVIALAIVDDIIAIVVIAAFYSGDLSVPMLGWAAVSMMAMIVASMLGVRHPLPYALLGLCLWFAVLQSGVHATIAGVLGAMAIPARTELEPKEFLAHGRWLLNYFEESDISKGHLTEQRQQVAVDALEDACEKAQSPLHRLEEMLHPWASILVMPLFALANAGVPLTGGMQLGPVAWGTALGLVVGKPVGILAGAWLMVKLGWADLPAEVSWQQLHGAGWLAGVGFTMSLFIAALAFRGSDLLADAKLGVLAGSLVAGLVGAVLLYTAGGQESASESRTAAEA